MDTATNDVGFIVWGIDRNPYGPVELPTLVSWVKDERVTAETWIFACHTGAWQKASEMTELQIFFRSKPVASSMAAESAGNFDPRSLRRVKILAGLTNEQLDFLIRFVTPQRVPQWSIIVRQGDRGDSMFLILEGELRVRIMVEGKEKILTTLGVGEFFGDISLFDHGARSADVVANADSLVVRIAAEGFERLAKEAPHIATPFLQAIAKTLTARIRADNDRALRGLIFRDAYGPTAGVSRPAIS